MQIEKKKYHTWLPCVKGAVTVRYNILGIAVNIRLKMYWYRTEFFGAVTEGLLAEVMAEAERFDAGDPSVLTADKVCIIWVLRVSRRMEAFDKCQSCRKPAPFGKGAKN